MLVVIITQSININETYESSEFHFIHCRRTIKVQDNVPSTIAEDEEESPSPSFPVVRTKSTVDPDGFEYREV